MILEDPHKAHNEARAEADALLDSIRTHAESASYYADLCDANTSFLERAQAHAAAADALSSLSFALRRPA